MNKLEVTERLLRFVGWHWQQYTFDGTYGFYKPGDGWQVGKDFKEVDGAPPISDWGSALMYVPALFSADSADGSLWREAIRKKLVRHPRVLAIRDWIALPLMGCEIQDVDSDPYENPSSISDVTGETYEEAFCMSAYSAIIALGAE